MKKVITVFVVLSLIVTCFGCEKASDDRIVGTIQNENIYFWEFSFFLDSVKTELLNQAQISSDEEISEFWKNSEIDGVPASDVAINKAFEQTVLFKTKVLLAKQNGETITPDMQKEINKQIAETKQSVGGESDFKETLKSIGINESNYTELMENTFLVNSYFAKLVENQTIYISDEDIQAYYNAHEKEYRTSVTAKHILFSILDENQNPKSQTEQEQAKQTAQSVYTQIMDGTLTFDQAMADYSEDPGLQQNPNGYIFGKGEMTEIFETTAFNLDIGQISKPVLSEYGWHIIQLTQAQTTPLEDVKDNIFSLLASEAFDSYVKDAGKNYQVTRQDSVLRTISL